MGKVTPYYSTCISSKKLVAKKLVNWLNICNKHTHCSFYQLSWVLFFSWQYCDLIVILFLIIFSGRNDGCYGTILCSLWWAWRVSDNEGSYFTSHKQYYNTWDLMIIIKRNWCFMLMLKLLSVFATEINFHPL